MGAVEDKVHELIEMLDSGLEQYKSYAEDMHRLNAFLEERVREFEIKKANQVLCPFCGSLTPRDAVRCIKCSGYIKRRS